MSKQKWSEGGFSFSRLYAKFGTVLILIVFVIVASLLSENFLTGPNLTNVLRQIVVVTIMGFGSTFVLIAGQINIAYDSLIALVGCSACLVMVQTGNVFLSVLFGLVLGVAIGFVYGFLVTKFTLPAFIVGLAINTIARGIILLLTSGKTIGNLGDFAIIGQGYIGFIPIPVVIMIGCLLLSWFMLNKSCFGRHVFAVGGNRKAAIASGINADWTITKIYMFDGLMTAVASIVFMSRMAAGQPSAGTGYAFDAITGVVVGGTSIAGGVGSIGGTVVGATIVGIINNIMNLMNVNSYWQQITQGVVILVAVIVDVLTKRSLAKVKLSGKKAVSATK